MTKQIYALNKTHELGTNRLEATLSESSGIIRDIFETLKNYQTPKSRINEAMVFQEEFQNTNDLNAVMQRVSAGENLERIDFNIDDQIQVSSLYL